MNIDDRPMTNDRPRPIHTFWENFKWP